MLLQPGRIHPRQPPHHLRMSDNAKEAAQTRLTTILHQDRGRLEGFIRRRLPAFVSDQDPEDILSDVVVKLLERADILTEVENLTAYLFTALGHRLADLFRRPGADTEHLDDQPVAAPGDLEQNAILDQALSLLSAAERAVWMAVELEGWTFRELAERWKEPIGTLLSRKSRATQALRQSLTDSGFTES